MNWDEWRRTKLTPAFRALRRAKIFATHQHLPCCFEHGELDMYRMGEEKFVLYTYSQTLMMRHKKVPLELYVRANLGDSERRTSSILGRYVTVEKIEEGFKLTPKVHAHERWANLRKWLFARAIALYWHGLTARLYAPGGVGAKRDRAAFEADFVLA
jgi:hypothetical protein